MFIPLIRSSSFYCVRTGCRFLYQFNQTVDPQKGQILPSRGSRRIEIMQAMNPLDILLPTGTGEIKPLRLFTQAECRARQSVYLVQGRRMMVVGSAWGKLADALGPEETVAQAAKRVGPELLRTVAKFEAIGEERTENLVEAIA